MFKNVKLGFAVLLPMLIMILLAGKPLTDSDGVPISKMTSEVTPDAWMVLGAFPNPTSPDPIIDNIYDIGYVTDFLSDLGGESRAVFNPETRISYHSHSDGETTASAMLVKPNELGIIDFEQMYTSFEYKVAYALMYLESEVDQIVYGSLGSDDAVKVWVNNNLVHENYTFRALTPGEDQFELNLTKGLNRVLVKVVNGVRGWGFSLSIQDAQSWAIAEAEKAEQRLFEDFLNCRLEPAWYNPWDEYFYPGEFPDMKWDKPMLADLVLGDTPMNIRWFDSEHNEVSSAEDPGRYGYVAETVSLSGKPVIRAGTLYCWPWDWIGWSEKPYARLEPLSAAQFDEDVWTKHEAAIAGYVGRMTLLSILEQREGSVLMSYLHEMNQGKFDIDPLDNPLIADDEYHIQLQQKIGGHHYAGPGLTAPGQTSNGTAPVLKKGFPKEAGFKKSIIKDVKKVCEDWFEASNEPFITLIARNGVVIYHEATGGDAGGRFTLETATPMASITKLLTGITFAQFIEQELIQIDDPVGKYFPHFPVDGPKAMTLRHCFTHTSGLVGHESWGGVHNHRLENIVANQLDYLPVGLQSTYNGDGYDLAGRVMEAVANKSIFRVIYENVLIPLEMEHSSIEEDLAFSLHSTAGDIAKIGQMLLNRGSYGDTQFFSPDVFDQIVPLNLSQFYPGMDWDQGIGITYMNTRHPDAGKNGTPENQTILSTNTIGHGSATSAVLRVDLENGLVITQSRRRAGSHYDKYLTELLLAVERNLK